MKKSREVLDSGRIAEVQTTKIAERIDLLLERLASTKHGRECGKASFKLGEERRSRRASRGEVEVLMELRIHGRHGQVRRGSTATWRYLDGEIREKEQWLTGSSRACSGKPEEDRSVRISPVTREKEEDVVVAVVDPGSIPTAERYSVTRRSSSFHRSGS
jgi:hypothetical protein